MEASTVAGGDGSPDLVWLLKEGRNSQGSTLPRLTGSIRGLVESAQAAAGESSQAKFQKPR
jgi:hypothetical protein